MVYGKLNRRGVRRRRHQASAVESLPAEEQARRDGSGGGGSVRPRASHAMRHRLGVSGDAQHAKALGVDGRKARTAAHRGLEKRSGMPSNSNPIFLSLLAINRRDGCDPDHRLRACAPGTAADHFGRLDATARTANLSKKRRTGVAQGIRDRPKIRTIPIAHSMGWGHFCSGARVGATQQVRIGFRGQIEPSQNDGNDALPPAA